MTEQPSGRDAAESSLKGHIALYTGYTRPVAAFVPGTANVTIASEDVERLLRSHWTGIQDAIATRIRQAVAERELPAGADPSTLVAGDHTFLKGLSVQFTDGVLTAPCSMPSTPCWTAGVRRAADI